MRLVADSHALVWYTQGSPKLSERAAETLREAEASEGIVVSVASLVDLWYVTQTTQGVSAAELSGLRDILTASSAVSFYPLDIAVADSYTTISRDLLSDPWDRFIVATAMVLGVALVSRDGAIQECGLVDTIW